MCGISHSKVYLFMSYETSQNTGQRSTDDNPQGPVSISEKIGGGGGGRVTVASQVTSSCTLLIMYNPKNCQTYSFDNTFPATLHGTFF